MYTKVSFIIVCSIFTMSGCLGQKAEQQKINKTEFLNKDVKTNDNGWLLNYEDVHAKSIKENKPIMANFTGSDWCGWCKKLKKAVFDTEVFQQWAAENVILFELDYPRRTAQDPEIRKQNQELQQTFRGVVRGYPTVLIFDIERTCDDKPLEKTQLECEENQKKSDGIQVLGKMGYMGSGDAFVNMATNYISKRK